MQLKVKRGGIQILRERDLRDFRAIIAAGRASCPDLTLRAARAHLAVQWRNSQLPRVLLNICHLWSSNFSLFVASKTRACASNRENLTLRRVREGRPSIRRPEAALILRSGARSYCRTAGAPETAYSCC